jgi:hypothetical protein
VRAQFYERQSSGVLALSAVGTVEVRMTDVRESCSLKLGKLHLPTLAPGACGSLLYNSYSLNRKRTPYDGARLGRASIHRRYQNWSCRRQTAAAKDFLRCIVGEVMPKSKAHAASQLGCRQDGFGEGVGRGSGAGKRSVGDRTARPDEELPARRRTSTCQCVHVRLHALLVFVGPVSAGHRVIAMRLRTRGCLAFSCRLSRAGL